MSLGERIFAANITLRCCSNNMHFTDLQNIHLVFSTKCGIVDIIHFCEYLQLLVIKLAAVCLYISFSQDIVPGMFRLFNKVYASVK